jgi:Membrane fusion protein Use1
VFQRLAPKSNSTDSLTEVEPSLAEADLRSVEDKSSLLPLEPSLDAAAASTALLPPGTLSSIPDAAPTQALLQHRTALQEELSMQLAQMAGQLRRNAEHFSSALVADQAIVRNAEENISANFEVIKQERVRLRDHRSKSLGTTCLTITSVLVVSIAFVMMLFIVRLT